MEASGGSLSMKMKKKEKSVEEECNGNGIILSSSSTVEIDDNPIPNPEEKEEEIINGLLELITVTVQDTIKEMTKLSDRVIKLQAKYKVDEGVGTPWGIFWIETNELGKKLEGLNLEFHEDCIAIFAHQFFLNAVYVYPDYYKDISILFYRFLQAEGNTVQRKESIIEQLLEFIYDVFDRATIYDEYINPPDPSTEVGRECLANRNLLEIEFPVLKVITKNKKFLEERLRLRYMNAAKFFGNLMSLIHGLGYEEVFHKFLQCLTDDLDVTKFLAVDQVLDLSGHLIKDHSALTTCLTSLADFLGKLDSKHPQKNELRQKLETMYYGLMLKPKIEVPNKLKILHQINPPTINKIPTASPATVTAPEPTEPKENEVNGNGKEDNDDQE